MVERKDAAPVERDRLVAELTAILRGHGAEHVYLFGSSVRGEARPDSDLDLAVAGLPPENFFPALAHLMPSSNRRIDLVDLDEDSPFVRHLRQERMLRLVG